MLLNAKLPRKFWAEAISTAVHLRNRCPTKAVKGMTPYEAWHGKKPKVEYLRCDAYAHIPKDERSKLDSKARKCILLGYSQETKGYRLYDPIRQKVLYSRDVQFNENEKDSEVVTSDDTDHHLILDFSSDPDSTLKPQLRIITLKIVQLSQYSEDQAEKGTDQTIMECNGVTCQQFKVNQ